MDNMVLPTREEMMAILEEANVDVPTDASLVQLKRLYNLYTSQVRANNTEKTSRPCEDSAADADETSVPAVHLNAQPDEHNPTVVTDENQLNATTESQQVDHQLELLRKKREMLQLQAEINALSSPTVVPAVNKLTDVSVIESMISKFTADDHYDINKWINDFEDACDMLQFDDRLRFVSCRRMLEGTAKVLLRTIVVYDYKGLKDALLFEFGRQYTTQEVYLQLRNRRLKPNDGIDDVKVNQPDENRRADGTDDVKVNQPDENRRADGTDDIKVNHPDENRRSDGDPAADANVFAATEMHQVNLQLELLRRERELLQLQAEVDVLSIPAMPPAANKVIDVCVIYVVSMLYLCIDVCDSMLAKFTADDHCEVGKWISDFEDACEMLQFDERLRFVACRRMFDGTAKVLLRTIAELKMLCARYERNRCINRVDLVSGLAEL